MKSAVSDDYRILSVMVPEQKSPEYGEIDAEIVVGNGNQIKSIIIINNAVDKIIDIN